MLKYLSQIIIIYYKLLLLLIISGCECYPTQKGIVLDEHTGLPIENAQISFGEENFQTDQYGHFDAFCSQCKPALIASKEGYKPFKIKIDNGGDKIYFEVNNNSTANDYEEPKYLNDDSTSLIVGSWKYHNSTHFEYRRNYDTLTIFLTKIDE